MPRFCRLRILGSRIRRARVIRGFVGSCLGRYRRGTLGLHLGVDPRLGLLLSVLGDKLQGFDDRCEKEGKQEKIGVGLEIVEGSGELCQGSA